MTVLSYKVRLATLWLLSTVAFFSYRTLALSEDATEVSLLGNDDFATYLLVLMVFAFLSLTLPFGINRLTNLVAGTIIGVLQAIMLVDGLTAYPSAIFNLMTGVTLVSTGSIAWLAYRWAQPTIERAATETDLPSERDRTPAGV